MEVLCISQINLNFFLFWVESFLLSKKETYSINNSAFCWLFSRRNLENWGVIMTKLSYTTDNLSCNGLKTSTLCMLDQICLCDLKMKCSFSQMLISLSSLDLRCHSLFVFYFCRPSREVGLKLASEVLRCSTAKPG